MTLLEYILYCYFGISLIMAFYGLGQLVLMSTKGKWKIVKDFKTFLLCVFIGVVMFLTIPIVMLYYTIKRI